MENVIILGTGIAGLTAAIYIARANLSPLLISGQEDGGQLMLTTEVENFPGFPDGINGQDLVANSKKQAEKFGAKFKTDIAEDFNPIDGGFEISLMGGDKIQTKTIIIATGASARWLGIPSEEKYKGRGVSTCATCDGAFYKGKEIIVVGGGDSAMEESLFLTKFATKVTVIHRRDEFRASKIMQDKFQKNENTEVIWDSVVEEILGDGKVVTGVKLKNVKTNDITEFKCDGVFLAIGHIPNTKFLTGKVDLDKLGYVKADTLMKTSVSGIFAAGDVQDTRFKQAITAAGSGCMAGMEAEKYLAEKE
ncbi:thioredoxin-disulfide reductase [Candidatus Woesearchaeota archaeon]|jgi:thioredoxin reductase (NADPH)|nr:thioredoxin-disulfide reductase [Candidatus Woesearchaeota archaeon]MBT5397387.1 thioredoxin-disulfide reductase [Candidatus Woesearchaeota archaeon]MBT5924345.1 thioredoxin-disulfide reductase [Candidatus Woesearchaeota archaeon]MBT6367767.1 thioredoxin-disulfide reductase [Candidatus Woesearchaeota archaeon]MBT7762787.1 thioredoxin-disulfide reductase [Candidatus Woesearchaeota archaeon]